MEDSKKLDDIHKVLYGNGNPGLKILVDRNTEFRIKTERMLWVIYAALLGNIAIKVWEIVTVTSG